MSATPTAFEIETKNDQPAVVLLGHLFTHDELVYLIFRGAQPDPKLAASLVEIQARARDVTETNTVLRGLLESERSLLDKEVAARKQEQADSQAKAIEYREQIRLLQGSEKQARRNAATWKTKHRKLKEAK